MQIERVFAKDSKHTAKDLMQEFISAQVDTIVGNYKMNSSNKENQQRDSNQKIA